ncbi:hypothetical protein ACFLSQ_03885 [Bacteroidota bacterium]
MKRIISLIIVFIISINFGIAQEFIKIAEVEINTGELAKTTKYQSTQFIFKSKQKTGFHLTFDVMDLIQSHINNIESKDKPKLIFIFENPMGESVTAAYSEFDNLLTNLPAVLMYDKTLKKVGDSLVLGDNEEGDVDFTELEEQISQFSSKKRLHLQIKTIPVSEKTRMLQDATIIFPKDLNTDRWINGIDKIKIFKYESGRIPPEPVIEEQPEEPKSKSKKKKKSNKKKLKLK